MIRTTLTERKLQPGFTAHVVELISNVKIQTAPHKTALPLGLSAAGGVILLLLSLSFPHSPLFPLGEWLGGFSASENTSCRSWQAPRRYASDSGCDPRC